MKINDVSKLTDLPISTLRFYERKKLIPDTFLKRDMNNYRIYAEEIVEFLDEVKVLLSVGFSVEELSFLFGQQFNPSYEQRNNLVEQKIKEIEVLQKRLKKSKKFLRATLETCRQSHANQEA